MCRQKIIRQIKDDHQLIGNDDPVNMTFNLFWQGDVETCLYNLCAIFISKLFIMRELYQKLGKYSLRSMQRLLIILS